MKTLALLACVLAAPTASPQLPPSGVPQDPSGAADSVREAWLERITEDIRLEEYRFSPLGSGVFGAPSRAQGLRSRVSAQGLEVFPRSVGADGEGAPWRLALRTRSFGRMDGDYELGPAVLEVRGERAELDHGLLLEWLENRTEGIEQGWTIAARPMGSEPLWIGLEFGGELALRVDDGARSGILVDACGEVQLRYTGLRAFDASGRELEARLLPGPGGVGILVEDGGATYPLTVDPLLSDPAWTAESNQANAHFGYSVSTAGDVNGDGYSDVIVGAISFDNGQTDEGRAIVYHGSASGLAASPAWTVESDQDGANFGNSVSTAGDVNGDGYSDVIVGAVFFDNGQSNEGRAFVYHGSASGLASSPAWTTEADEASALFGNSVSTAGDVNGDGYSDVIVGAPASGHAYVYQGSANGLASSPAWTESDQAGVYFGNSVSTAGDVNGDGYSDVIVGAPLFDNVQTDEGRAYVYHGSASGLATNPAWTAESDQASAQFGRVSTAGDVNGDGYSDVIVGAILFDNGQTDEGRAYVYHGSASGLATNPAWTAESDQASAWFGWSVSTAGDVNGDGYSDVIVGAPQFDNGLTDKGRANVYQGSASGLATSPDWTDESNQASAWFGMSVSMVGDVNGDGYSDVIVGAHRFDNGQSDEGRAYVFHGSASGLATTPAWTAEPDQGDAWFGNSVSTAGDVNGDGYSDVIVGASLFDNGQTSEGRAYVFHGSASGLATTPAWTAESNQAGAQFGNSVSTAGDVNGDGYSDVLVGAPNFNNGQTQEGRAFVFQGSASGLATNPAWTAESDQAGAQFGISVSTAGDVNGDGYSDVIVGAAGFTDGQTSEGRAFVYPGSASGLATSPAWTAEGDQDFAGFGASVSTAGDVNGDGYSDAIVGAPSYSNGEDWEGRAYVYHGSASGLSPSPAWTAESDQASAFFGYSVSTAGDVNGDGYSDVLVGAPYFDNGSPFAAGRIFVHHGSTSGLDSGQAWIAPDSALFGWSVSTAGDVNGDGYSDVIVGAIDADWGELGEGVALMLLGSASGVEPGSWFAEGNQAGANLGNAVSTAGDVNGDGYSDVIVGASGFDNGQTNEGRAFVYFGNEGRGGWIRAPQQRRLGGLAPIAVLGRSNSPTSFQIRASFERSLAGFAWASPVTPTVRLEWEAEPSLGGTFDGLGIQSGASQAVVGSPLTFDEIVAGLSTDTPYRWRARLRTNNPLLPVTPWFSLAGDGRTETKVRTATVSPRRRSL